MKKVMIISPHMDDEVLGCSSLLQEEDLDITIVYSTCEHATVNAETLQKENANLMEFINARAVMLETKALNKMDAVPSATLINEFESILKECAPDTILIPNPSYNQDHRALYEAALTALRPHDVIPFVGKVLLYEQPETFGTLRKVDPFKPLYFRPVDINFKIRSYLHYESQVRDHRSIEHIKSIAQVRGMQANMDFAEAFEIVRWVD